MRIRALYVKPGKTTITLERGGLTLVVKGVPAQVCPNCGEEYVDEPTATRLLQIPPERSTPRPVPDR